MAAMRAAATVLMTMGMLLSVVRGHTGGAGGHQSTRSAGALHICRTLSSMANGSWVYQPDNTFPYLGQEYSEGPKEASCNMSRLRSYVWQPANCSFPGIPVSELRHCTRLHNVHSVSDSLPGQLMTSIQNYGVDRNRKHRHWTPFLVHTGKAVSRSQPGLQIVSLTGRLISKLFRFGGRPSLVLIGVTEAHWIGEFVQKRLIWNKKLLTTWPELLAAFTVNCQLVARELRRQSLRDVVWMTTVASHFPENLDHFRDLPDGTCNFTKPGLSHIGPAPSAVLEEFARIVRSVATRNGWDVLDVLEMTKSRQDAHRGHYFLPRNQFHPAGWVVDCLHFCRPMTEVWAQMIFAAYCGIQA
eukprot:NODE_1900_length_1363_cov_27.445205_g1720_i0.p1 GENE.NODE_1900_length_1363_cov_27.445205_g1720_i0~~NODE_1900_length_1363_cov_27.445205_g1720_i0.p1  ORF type:complete len:388 (-),score=53.46 NODE_1900_length_1363_cov_27.445205_g1720_i0:199-1266(-)